MKREDSEDVFRIIERAGMFTPEEILVAHELAETYLDMPHQEDYFFVVAENADGRIVGYLSYGPAALAEGAYDLYWVVVEPESQGRGHGKELVAWLEEKVREEGGRMILIETSSQSKYQTTRQFYLHMGYKEVSRIPHFYRPGDDRITYAKYFPS